MQMNKPTPRFAEKTHEGAQAARMTPEQALRRSVMSCFLFENEFYEDGEEIAARIGKLASEVDPRKVLAMAIEARHVAKLRHAPLLLLAHTIKSVSDSGGRFNVWMKEQVKDYGAGHPWVKERTPNIPFAIVETISRADELAELVAIYWSLNADKNKPIGWGSTLGAKHAPLPAQMKKGLASAFLKFDAYQLAKYDRAKAVRLRDVLRLCHAKPDTPERGAMWKQLLDGTLPAPDTWEVALSGGANKKEAFERLLREGKLGYLALLRNLRNMDQAGVETDLMALAIRERRGAHNVLPFRYVAAARAVPRLELALDQALIASVADGPRLAGATVVLVDVSGSMNAKLSAKSDLTRMDAAATLASIINAESLRVFSFSDHLCEGPPRVGMAGIDAIKGSQAHVGTNLAGAIRGLILHNIKGARLIVITDEQANQGWTAGVATGIGWNPSFRYGQTQPIPEPAFGRCYMINVASAKNGVGYGRKWTHIDGFSENVLRFIAEYEKDTV